MEETDNNKKNKPKLAGVSIAAGVFLLLLAAMAIIRSNTKASSFLARTLSRKIVEAMGRVSSLVPFSMYEIFLYIAGSLLIVSLVRIIIYLVRKKWLRSLRIVVAIILAVLIFGNIYMASAGFAYADEKNYAPLYGDAITEADLADACDYFLQDFNELADLLPREKDAIKQPYSDKQLSEKLRAEYSRHGTGYTPKCKTILSSKIMSHMHIRGVFFAPFGEANINGLMPAAEKPYAMAHEMAHAKGIMVERNAEDMATYITLMSRDPYIRYSAYMETFFQLLDSWEKVFNKPEKEQEYTALVDPRIYAEYRANYENFWGKYNSLDKITDALNDEYLNLMGQDGGTGSYQPKPETETKPVTDPDTGEIVINPDTGEPVYEEVPSFNSKQRLFYGIYEQTKKENQSA